MSPSSIPNIFVLFDQQGHSYSFQLGSLAPLQFLDLLAKKFSSITAGYPTQSIRPFLVSLEANHIYAHARMIEHAHTTPCVCLDYWPVIKSTPTNIWKLLYR